MKRIQRVGLIALPAAAIFVAAGFSLARRSGARAPSVAVVADPSTGAARAPASATRPPATEARAAGGAEVGPGAATATSGAPTEAPIEAPIEARREAEAYPWDDFEGVLGRELTDKEREQLRDLRKEHGLRLAEARGRRSRGELSSAEFERWREERAAVFRDELQAALSCSAEDVQALLTVKMRAPVN
ncbi:MAG: hypothetical protein R3B48_20880 [Kofleriaceae bacterium]